MPIGEPLVGRAQAEVAVSCKADVDAAVAASQAAFLKWRELTVKARAAIIFKIHHLIDQHKDELATLIMKEHGKTKAEALAEVAKANETVEYATSMPQLISGRTQEVSRGVFCTERRDPLGTCVCVCLNICISRLFALQRHSIYRHRILNRIGYTSNSHSVPNPKHTSQKLLTQSSNSYFLLTGVVVSIVPFNFPMMGTTLS